MVSNSRIQFEQKREGHLRKTPGLIAAKREGKSEIGAVGTADLGAGPVIPEPS